MSIQVKDRVRFQNENDKKDRRDKGLVVKVYRNRNGSIKTAGVLWDSDWPRAVQHNPRLQPGRIFYYKPDDLKVIGSWKI